MKPTYVATVAAPIETVWAVLTDVDNVLAALPGAALARDGDSVTGSLKCKLGSAQVTYRVTARAEVGESDLHTASIAVTGTEARGTGTLAASLTVALRAAGTETGLEISGDVEATGRGESTTDKQWAKVLETLVSAVLPQPAPAPEPIVESTPARPPLAVAPPPAEPSAARGSGAFASPRMIAGLVGILLLVLARRRRRKHK